MIAPGVYVVKNTFTNAPCQIAAGDLVVVVSIQKGTGAYLYFYKAQLLLTNGKVVDIHLTPNQLTANFLRFY